MIGRKGGKARAASMTAEQRQALARKAGKKSGAARKRRKLESCE